MQEQTIIADRLQQIRREQDMTQNEFAESIGITARAYKNYEYSISEPPVAMIKSIVETYGVDPWWIISGQHSESANISLAAVMAAFDEYLEFSEGMEIPKQKKMTLFETILKTKQTNESG